MTPDSPGQLALRPARAFLLASWLAPIAWVAVVWFLFWRPAEATPDDRLKCGNPALAIVFFELLLGILAWGASAACAIAAAWHARASIRKLGVRWDGTGDTLIPLAVASIFVAFPAGAMVMGAIVLWVRDAP